MTELPDEGPVRVFISYTHDSDEHVAAVRDLWVFLRGQGIDARLDLPAVERRQDWPAWMLEQVREARFVLVVVSPAYKRRSEGLVGADEGRGVQFEARLIREFFYRDQSAGVERFLPVLLPGVPVECIPDFLSPVSATSYRVSSLSVAGCEALLRVLTGQPDIVVPLLGEVPVLRPSNPEFNTKQAKFPTSHPHRDELVLPPRGQEFYIKKAKLFISYSHRDERYMKRLVTHLTGLRREGLIADWHDRMITAGDDWRQTIDANLDTADCVMLLITPDFLASDYCYSIEMERALKKHQEGRALVIPVIVRPADWQHTQFSNLQVLPKDGKPVVEWASRDRAWLDVAAGLRLALARTRLQE